MMALFVFIVAAAMVATSVGRLAWMLATGKAISISPR